MAIITMDGLIAALGTAQRIQWVKANLTSVAGRQTSLWTPVGQPGAGAVNLGQAAAGAVPDDASVGAHPFTNPTGGLLSYLGKVSGISAASGLITLWDVLWVWGSGGSGWSPTTTGAQNTSSPAALTRPDANGNGAEAWLEVLATMGAGAATPVLSYTNPAGTSGRTTGAMGYNSAAIIGSMYNFPLQASDVGIKSVQSLTLGVSMSSGTARVIIARRIAEIPCQANIGFLYNGFDLGLPRVYDDAAIMATILPSSTASGPTMIRADLVQG